MEDDADLCALFAGERWCLVYDAADALPVRLVLLRVGVSGGAGLGHRFSSLRAFAFDRLRWP